MHFPAAPFLLLAVVFPLANCGDARDPSAHVATEEQLVMRSPDGGVRFAVDTSDSYRAEIRTPTGTVKGIYSWLRPDGTSKTVSYSANPQLGFRAVPFGQLGVALPPFPHKLNTKNHLEEGQKEEEEEDFVVVDRAHQFYGAAYPWQYAYMPGRGRVPGSPGQPMDKEHEDHKDFEDPDTDSVIVGEDPPCDEENPENCVVEEGDYEEGDYEDVEALPGFPGGSFPIVIPGAGGGVSLLEPQPGQEAAQSIPSASAIAGDFGIASAGPESTAFVGPGGIALALPSAEAAAGVGGMAISVPISSAQAGIGGLAIAGGQSLAIAGDYDPAQLGIGGGSQRQQLHLGRSGVTGNVGIYPIIANYFFYPPPGVAPGPGGVQQQQQKAQHQSYFYNLPPPHRPLYSRPQDGVLTYYGAARRFGSVLVDDAGESEKTDGSAETNAQELEERNIMNPETYPIAGRIASR